MVWKTLQIQSQAPSPIRSSCLLSRPVNRVPRCYTTARQLTSSGPGASTVWKGAMGASAQPPMTKAYSNVMHIKNVEHIPEEALTFGDLISSEGSAGIVRKAVWHPSDGSPQMDVAVKMVQCPGERGSLQYKSAVQLFEHEIDVLSRASACGDQICKLYGVSELSDGATMCCVMKLYGPTVLDLLRESGGTPLTLERIYSYSVDCLEVIAALHEKGIILQDFKPANVLLDEGEKAVVADFDMAADVGHRDGIANVNVSTGTPAYSSPEAWDPDNFGGVTVKTDIWSFACFMVHVATGKEPWPGMRWPSIRRAILQNCQTPEIPRMYPEHIQAVLKRCFAIIPESRPHAAELLVEFKRLPWFPAGSEGSPNADAAGAGISRLSLEPKDQRQ
mmetsp:Transcript_17108/g.47755  ORF Transcript_17108/g.47755 Transcript_17108/m.47755 type:complete len:390 (+) Transcript_17108:211-1380(+)